jgi:hypothetical protein
VSGQELRLLETPSVLSRDGERQSAHYYVCCFENFGFVGALPFERERLHFAHGSARRFREPEICVVGTRNRGHHGRQAPIQRARSQRFSHGRQGLEPAGQAARFLRPARGALAALQGVRFDGGEAEGVVTTETLEQIQAPPHLETQSTRVACPPRKLRVERFQSLDRTGRAPRSIGTAPDTTGELSAMRGRHTRVRVHRALFIHPWFLSLSIARSALIGAANASRSISSRTALDARFRSSDDQAQHRSPISRAGR